MGWQNTSQQNVAPSQSNVESTVRLFYTVELVAIGHRHRSPSRQFRAEYAKDAEVSVSAWFQTRFMTIRNQSEYLKLMAFAKGCASASTLFGLGIAFFSCTTFLPRAYPTVRRATLVLFWLFLCSTTLCVRSFVMAYQCKREKSQTFDRPCPEYITAATLILIIVTLLWPK